MKDPDDHNSKIEFLRQLVLVLAPVAVGHLLSYLWPTSTPTESESSESASPEKDSDDSSAFTSYVKRARRKRRTK